MFSKALRRHSTAFQVQRSVGPTQAASSEWLKRVAAQGQPAMRTRRVLADGCGLDWWCVGVVREKLRDVLGAGELRDGRVASQAEKMRHA